MTVRSFLSLCVLALVGSACAPSEDNPTPGDRAGLSVSRAEQRMLAIVEAQQQLFAAADNGEIGEDDFVRRAAAVASDYDQYLSANPSDVEALILYGKFLRSIGSDEDAMIMFNRANNLDGKIAVVKQQIGSLLAEQGKYAQALAFYLTAVDLEPETAIYHFGVGQLLYAYRDAFVEDGAFTREGIDRQMLEAFAEAVRLEPGNRDFRFRLGEAYYDLATPDWPAALAVWDGLAEGELSDVERDAVRLHKARVLIELGDAAQAGALLAEPVAEAFSGTRAQLQERLQAMVGPAQ